MFLDVTKRQMKKKYLGSCNKLRKDFPGLTEGCCCSCHEDDELGYIPLGEIEFSHGYYSVCCEMLNSYEEKEGNNERV